MNKKYCERPPLAGLLQAVGIVAYVMFVSWFFSAMENYSPPVAVDSPFLFFIFFLTLFVFSAAVTGLLFFGFPAYLLLHAQLKKAFLVMGYTVAWMFAFLIFFWLVVFLIAPAVTIVS